MRRVLIILFVVSSTYCDSQDTTFYNDFDYKQFIFGNLDSSLFSTGFLLDKNSDLGDSWKKFQVNSFGKVESIHNVNDWFTVHQYLRYGEVNMGGIPHLDSLMWPLYDRIFEEVNSQEVVSLPLFIVDFNVNRFNDNAEKDGNILFYNNQFHEGLNPELGIDNEHLFFSGLLADTIANSDISITLDEKYILTNRDKEIDFVRFSINGFQTDLSINQTLLLSSHISNVNKCKIQLHYTDSEIIESEFIFYYSPPTQKLGTIGESLLFDEVDDIIAYPYSVNQPKLRYGIKYGCGNTELRKPVIFVAGFGMSSSNILIQFAGQADCSELYDKYNLDGMMEELLNSGHDIIVARFIPAVGDLISGAARITELIEMVNERKFANGSYVENIIIGYSAGAVAVRYALDQMEHTHMFYDGPHPHTKLYASFEGEHQGASIPLGMQLMLKYLKNNHGSIQTNVIDYMANSPQAKQLLKHYWPYTGKVGNAPPNTQGQGPDPWRGTFMNAMEITYAHGKQIEKYGYAGYPAFTRNIAIVNGSRTTTSFNGSVVVNNPYSFDYGHTIFEQENASKKWKVNLYANSQQEGSTSTPKTVYRFVDFNFWGNVSLLEHYQTNTNMLLYDNGPGGFLTGDDDMLIKVMDKAAGNNCDGCLPGQPDIYSFKTTSFTPVVSCLDIRNFNPLGYNRQMHYDLWENELLYNDFDLINNPQGNFGYPVIGNVSNHFDITPFQAIYADEFNQTHISSYTPIVNGVPTVNDFNSSQQPDINDFLFKELQYKRIFLQNNVVGWNTNGETYVAEYEAQNEIVIGEEVTPQTDIAPYNVLVNGDVICHAGDSIRIKNGFYAEVGSKFHAYIHPLECTVSGGGSSAIILPDSNNEQIENNSLVALDLKVEEKIDFKVYPNPSEGQFTIEFSDQTEYFKVQILNLSGEVIYTNEVISNKLINLSLATGVYIVKVESADKVQLKKIIIK